VATIAGLFGVIPYGAVVDAAESTASFVSGPLAAVHGTILGSITGVLGGGGVSGPVSKPQWGAWVTNDWKVDTAAALCPSPDTLQVRTKQRPLPSTLQKWGVNS